MLVVVLQMLHSAYRMRKNDMLNAVSAVKPFVTKLNGAISEEDKTVAITKTVLKIMKFRDQ
jgi:hypothetical protein